MANNHQDERTSVGDATEKNGQPAVPAPATEAAAGQRRTNLQYVERIDVAETFADSVQSTVFDGQTLRIEFCVTRVSERGRGSSVARRVPACRLVLTVPAAVDLSNRIQRIAARLTQARPGRPDERGDPNKTPS